MSAYSNPVARARRQALRMIGLQVLATLVLAALYAATSGSKAGLSALAGGGVGVLATAYMAFAVLRHGLGSPALRVMMGFVVGWLIKVLMTIGLLIAVFRAPGLQPLPVLVAYVTSFIVYWGAALKGSRPD